MDELVEIKADLKGIERRYQELDNRNRELDRRLIILEVSGAERHTTTINAIKALQDSLDQRAGRLERVLWGTVAFFALGIGGVLLKVVFTYGAAS